MSRLPLILVTGFNRFGKLESNPTERLMADVSRLAGSLEGCRVVTEVLPTEFEASGRRMRELIEAHDPDAVLCFGVSRRAETFLLERFALNIDDASEPDNAGRAPPGEPIVPGGPAAYVSTLPLEAILRALREAGVPAGFSNHAGTYVCNHVFYVACDQASLGRARPCGFVHVPLPSESKEPSSPPSLVAGAMACITALARALAAREVA